MGDGEIGIYGEIRHLAYVNNPQGGVNQSLTVNLDLWYRHRIKRYKIIAGCKITKIIIFNSSYVYPICIATY